MYYMDYLGSMHKMDFAAQGYGSNFTLRFDNSFISLLTFSLTFYFYSIFDKYYKKGMDLEGGKEVIQKCIKELKKRFLINAPNYIAKIITKDGIEVIEMN